MGTTIGRLYDLLREMDSEAILHAHEGHIVIDYPARSGIERIDITLASEPAPASRPKSMPEPVQLCQVGTDELALIQLGSRWKDKLGNGHTVRVGHLGLTTVHYRCEEDSEGLLAMFSPYDDFLRQYTHISTS